MDYTHIIWDFNGTLLNDLKPCIDVLNILLARRSLPVVNEEQYKNVFGFPIINYYRQVGFDFEKEDYCALADEWALLYKNAVVDCNLNQGIRAALNRFKALNKTQIILSATELGMLKEQIKPLGIESYFTEILALGDLQAVSKVQLGKSWAERAKPQKALFIGDTEHDYETACAMGVDCVLIANGHQSKSRLIKLGVPVLDTADELITLI